MKPTYIPKPENLDNIQLSEELNGLVEAMGTIITDRIEEAGEDYYVLKTSHDYLEDIT